MLITVLFITTELLKIIAMKCWQLLRLSDGYIIFSTFEFENFHNKNIKKWLLGKL